MDPGLLTQGPPGSTGFAQLSVVLAHQFIMVTQSQIDCMKSKALWKSTPAPGVWGGGGGGSGVLWVQLWSRVGVSGYVGALSSNL